MSKTRLISAFAMSLMMMAAACWFVTGAFPLAAAPQSVADAPGVAVDLGGSQLIHRDSVNYPAAAFRNHVEGTVAVQVKLGANGEVADATVLSGPDELRKAVLTSVLDWHFTRDAAGSTRQVTVTFQLPKEQAPSGTTVRPDPTGTITGVVGGVPGGVQGGVRSGVIGGIIGSVPTARMSVAPREGKVAAIRIVGLGDQAKTELMSRIPIREGDAFTPETYKKLAEAATQYDEHLSVSAISHQNGEVTLQVAAPRTTSMFTVPDIPVPPGAIRVGGNAQQAKLVSQPKPVYPELAKQARISGVIHLSALIGKDGAVKDLKVMSGHPLLIQAAMDAVQQWRYEPTLLNGAPVEVLTQIDVNFTLSQ